MRINHLFRQIIGTLPPNSFRKPHLPTDRPYTQEDESALQTELLKAGSETSATASLRFYGQGMPYLQADALPGHLFVIEGSDYSGRSTQTYLLKNWLEVQGHAVLNIGIKRSALISEAIESAKQGHALGKTTLSLLYATDFADQLENKILPALKAGFVVLADRYIYTLMARDLVRGAERDWLEELFGIALIPDHIFFLDVPPQELLHRGFLKMGRISYWESGMDMGLSTDMFESFHKYQLMIAQEFNRMAEKYGFEVLDGKEHPYEIQGRIRDKVRKLLQERE